ncbi:hypothetical protein BKP45_15265 [Anaerobacillus alkalidiazotrophicus]|uniref:Uncharacterized protein n=1 Tax=Anaerobacillus alkalidiazotrophicus TaxID=472963 RepID=A0A1S2M4U0_9BACI|nr:hypothetical protein [Anaerobacillus alkalidiazotrophicus]OIJ18887.1 hypothetical protein BKP45_15265 [Anaerobacillus alkalidiazotrophicus]
MKKKLGAMVCIMVLFTPLYGVSADVGEEDSILINEDIVTSVMESEDGSIGIMSAGTRTSSTKTYGGMFSSYYAISRNEATYVQDYMHVRGRIFDSNGGMIFSDYDDQTHTREVSLKYDHGGNYYRNYYAVGNHFYQRSGYIDTRHETKSYW